VPHTDKFKTEGGHEVEVVTSPRRRSVTRMMEEAEFAVVSEARFASLEELRERRFGKPKED
jgi:hypothetical protein